MPEGVVVPLGSNDPPATHTVGIEYEDAYGNLSRRVITILSMFDDGDGEGKLIAHCHLRDAERHFYVSQLRAFYDPATNDPLSAVRLIPRPA